MYKIKFEKMIEDKNVIFLIPFVAVDKRFNNKINITFGFLIYFIGFKIYKDSK